MRVTNTTAQDYWFGPLHLAAGNGSYIDVDDTSSTSLYLTDDSVADAINTLSVTGKVSVSNLSSGVLFPRPTGTPEVLHGDGSPEGLVYAGQGSIYLRRDLGTIYSKTTGVHVNTGWSAYGYGPVTTAGLFSVGPPATPSDGDEWVALAVDTGNLATTDGTVWRFRYNAQSGSSYKWEFCGGGFLSKNSNLGNSLNNYTQVGATGYYYDVTSMSWTTVRAGDYIVEGTAEFGSNGTGNPGNEAVEVFVGSALQNARKDGTTNSSSAGGIGTFKKVTGVAASTVIGFCGSAASVAYTIANVSLKITPARIS